jgi:diaminopimelate decarboxylase
MKLDKFNFDEIAEQYGTPFYLYDMDQAAQHLKDLQSHLPENVDVLYCVKANPNPKLIEVYKDLADGLDMSSGGEVELSYDMGCDPAKMSFAGPGKTDEELRRSLELGLGSISIESERELERLSNLAQEMGKTMNCLLRINPMSTPKSFAMKMGGVPSQFGVQQEDSEALFARALSTPGIRLIGIHIFCGTQCLVLDDIVTNAKQTLEIARKLSEKNDFTPEEVNLGGGIGVAYFDGQTDVPAVDVSKAMGELISSFRKDNPRFAKTRFVLELGRYLIGRFGIYVVSVVNKKAARGKEFTIMDGGMNHCFPATGNFGQLIKKNYPVINLSRKVVPENETAQELVGPLCTPLDSMARNLKLPPCEEGDLVAWVNCGAYSFSASPLLFLSHPTPIELMHYKGEISVARRRISAKELY